MVCEVMAGLSRADVSSDNDRFETVRALVLIDEVEAHLHPRLKMQVMTGLRRALPGVTFIATTHDPLCLRGMMTGEVAVLRRIRREDGEEHVLPDCAELLDDLPEIEYLGVEQLLTSDFFGLFSTEHPDAQRTLDSYAEGASAAISDDQTNTVAQELAELLPLGHTATEQIISNALLEYLKRRRKASVQELHGLKTKAKSLILDALEGK
jgi:hypothetical protein